MKPGDIIENTAASPGNPIKFGMLVKKSAKSFVVIAEGGQLSEYTSSGFLRVVGHVDFRAAIRKAASDET